MLVLIRKLQGASSRQYAAQLRQINARRLLWTSPSFFEVAEYHFYDALARATYEAASADERPQHLEALAAHYSSRGVGRRTARQFSEPCRLGGRGDRTHRRRDMRRCVCTKRHSIARQHGRAERCAAHEVPRVLPGARLETIPTHIYARAELYDRWARSAKLKQIG